ncbi:phage terminase large subunit family protein [Geobacillus stearothermophilus]|uniref:phage terminase large subunit family protein n=1 Tax=Geobacillus stearothermophilus TaxID=1422 RepID=UPI002E1B2BCE|nr:phage terminase large subunit family protein [Geobacillus stearothermophilus]MED3740126.1 phage terminase large subunit family protein [Geobacillus stearothermophilus]MED3765981.1 phage terminase large subunit family protein [Geobacillus stearothermophilus]MED3773718.1 phage terminase large subunit family protein [Geobacillus stearothermophilus]
MAVKRRKNDTEGLFKEIAQVVAPPPELTVSEWADLYRRLSSESSAEPGQWRTDRAPYQREIMDAINDPAVETVVVMTSAQVGKTEILLNIIGYHIDYDPAPIMVMQPTLQMAQAFSKDRLAPMLRDTPALRGKVADARSRDSGNTVLHKTFPGGHITMVGANSPSGLASRPIRILLADEVDRFPASAGAEGDPLTLAEKRTTTFFNRKKVYVSTPTIKGISRIEAAFLGSSQEEWCLPCPTCGKHQPLTWAQIRFDDVTMECIHCGARHDEFAWKAGQGKWVAKSENRKVRGFHLNELASPWKRWSTIIAEFKEAKKGGPDRLKAWINTTLGETWEEQGDGVESDELASRRERYNCEVPDGVLLLTAGVDVQDDRLEVEVVGWGVGKESWGIEYRAIYGDPGQPAVWQQLDEYLGRTWKYADGVAIGIACACIDSGGHYTTEVYDFVKPREHRRIFAIKGQGGEGIPIVSRASRTNRRRVPLFTIGVDAGKELILSRLKVQFPGEAGYCHFPIEPEKGYDQRYFDGLTSEKRVVRFHKGRPKLEWIKRPGTRNEPLDCRNYATAALEILNPNLEVLAQSQKRGDYFKQSNPMTGGTKSRRRRLISRGVSL